jgi:hypothetical protein
MEPLHVRHGCLASRRSTHCTNEFLSDMHGPLRLDRNLWHRARSGGGPGFSVMDRNTRPAVHDVGHHAGKLARQGARQYNTLQGSPGDWGICKLGLGLHTAVPQERVKIGRVLEQGYGMTLDAEMTARHAASTFPSPLPAFSSSCAPSWTSPGRGAFLFFFPSSFYTLAFWAGSSSGLGNLGRGVKTGRQYTTTVWRWDGIPF